MTASNSNGSGTTTISIACVLDNFWTGSKNTDWNTKQNWNAGHVPVSTDLATIGVHKYTSGNNPIVSAATSVNYIEFGNQQATAITLTVQSGATFTITGRLIVDNNATPTFTGTTNQVGNVNISTAASIGVMGAGSILTIDPSLTAFTLLSDATGSASVDKIPTGGSIVGNVSVQRYITGGVGYRGYRLVSSPVNTNTKDAYGNYIYSINYLIATTGVVTGGITPGTYVSGYNFLPTSAASPNTKQGNPSIYLFRENLAPLYTSFVNSNFRAIDNMSSSPIYSFTADPNYSDPNSSIPVGNGYDLFFRGGEATVSPFVGGSTPANAIVVATGTLNQGPVTVHDWYTPNSPNLGMTVTTGTGSTPPDNSSVRGFNLVGNPYACSIDLNTMQDNPAAGIYAHGLNSVVYFLRPNSNTYDEYDTQTHQGIGGNAANMTNIVPSGVGFFVLATDPSAAQLTFNESAKNATLQVTGPSLYMGKPVATNTVQFIRLQMTADTSNTDATLIHFKDQASAAYSVNEDAPYKQGNGIVSLASTTSDHKNLMAVNRMPLKDSTITIPLNVNATANGTYSLKMLNIQGVPQMYDIWLMDAYKKDSLDMRHSTSYSFDVNKADTTTFGGYRFTLVVRQNPALAYKLLTFTATKENTNGRSKNRVQLAWTTKNEQNYTRFAVERSTDKGKTYQVIGSLSSTGAGQYSLEDKDPQTGENYYRLQQVDINNNVSYSEVVTVKYGNGNDGNNDINVYPNPVRNALNLDINVKKNNKDRYDIRICNNFGFIVRQVFAADSTWQTNVGYFLPGTYIVSVVNHHDQSFVGRAKFVKL